MSPFRHSRKFTFHFQSCGDATKRIGLKCNQLHFLASKYYWHRLKFIILQNCGSLAATASTPRAEICGSGDRLRERTALGTKNPPPPPDAMAGSVCLQPSRSVTEGPQAVKGEVDDRRTADGECLEDALVKGKRGTKPLDRRHREELDPRLDGGSTSLIVARSGTPELTAAARPRDRDKGHQDWRSTDLPQAPAGPGGGGHLATGIWRHLARVASDDISSTAIRHSASPLKK